MFETDSLIGILQYFFLAHEKIPYVDGCMDPITVQI